MVSMGVPGSKRPATKRAARGLLACALCALLALAACSRWRRADEKPLDQAGVGFRSIQQLHELQVTDEEVAEVVKAKNAGLSDRGCLELVRATHARGATFQSGDAVAALRGVDIGEEAILELARLGQLGPWVREAQAVRLAGFSEATVLELARRRAVGRPTLSSASLARMKNAGLTEEVILAAVREGASDAQADSIIQQHSARVPQGFRRAR